MLRNSTDHIFSPDSGRQEIDLLKIHNQQSLIIPPAVSPNTNQNPSFRQVFSDSLGHLLDYDQYFYSLSDTQLNQFSQPQWKIEYRFTDIYNVPDLSSQSILQSFIHLQSNQTLLDQWKRFHVTESDFADDYDSINDDTLLCSMSAFCNYLETCMLNAI